MLGPDAVLEFLLRSDFFNHTKQTIREEIIYVLIKTMLIFPDHAFNYKKMVSLLIVALEDSNQPKVRTISMEALCIVHNKIPNKLVEMLQPLSGKTYTLVQQRLARGQPPTLSEDGTVQFKNSQEEGQQLVKFNVRSTWQASTHTPDILVPAYEQAESGSLAYSDFVHSVDIPDVSIRDSMDDLFLSRPATTAHSLSTSSSITSSLHLLTTNAAPTIIFPPPNKKSTSAPLLPVLDVYTPSFGSARRRGSDFNGMPLLVLTDLDMTASEEQKDKEFLTSSTTTTRTGI